MITKLIIIAGAGTYPELIVRGAKKAGVPQVDVVAIKGSTSRGTVKPAGGTRVREVAGDGLLVLDQFKQKA